MAKPNLKPCAICGEDVEAKRARKSNAFQHLYFHEKCYADNRNKNLYKILLDKNTLEAARKEEAKRMREYGAMKFKILWTVFFFSLALLFAARHQLKPAIPILKPETWGTSIKEDQNIYFVQFYKRSEGNTLYKLRCDPPIPVKQGEFRLWKDLFAACGGGEEYFPTAIQEEQIRLENGEAHLEN